MMIINKQLLKIGLLINEYPENWSIIQKVIFVHSLLRWFEGYKESIKW